MAFVFLLSMFVVCCVLFLHFVDPCCDFCLARFLEGLWLRRLVEPWLSCAVELTLLSLLLVSICCTALGWLVHILGEPSGMVSQKESKYILATFVLKLFFRRHVFFLVFKGRTPWAPFGSRLHTIDGPRGPAAPSPEPRASRSRSKPEAEAVLIVAGLTGDDHEAKGWIYTEFDTWGAHVCVCVCSSRPPPPHQKKARANKIL